MLRRLAAALTGKSMNERLTGLERAIRKLAETEGSRLASLDARLGDLVQTVEEQPTAKDLREVRQALRGLTERQPERRLLDAVDQLAASGRPVLVGPWTGEVGFELLYWIPFVRWAQAHGQLSPAREVIVSRGGVASWYGRTGAAYLDILDLFTPDEFRAAVGEEKRKQRRPGIFDGQVVEAVARKRGLTDIDTLHPSLMYKLFEGFWCDEAGYARVDQFTRHQLLDPPDMRPAGLPATYAAVRFYFNECFPSTEENRLFARGVVSSLAAHMPVVVLNPGFSVDEHTDWIPDQGERIVTIQDSLTPASNLAVQSAVIGGARAFVGTYGGYSYLAPLYRVPALAFYSKQTFKQQHLYVAQRAFRQIGAGPLIPIDVTHTAVVQAALGAVVPA